MEILSLGHSSFLITMAGAGGAPVRILADPWLSDHAIGDLMARFPRLRADLAALPPIDAIWLSHGHTDHLDPESLLRLREELDPFPAFVIPASLAHLCPLLDEFLEAPETTVLTEDEPVDLRGVSLTGFFNPEPSGSNEDDVMVLAGTNGTESFLSESDAVLPLYDPDTRARLAEHLLGPEIRTAVFLTTKNHLGATMSMLAATGNRNRLDRLSRCLEETAEEIWSLYGPTSEADDDLFSDPRLTRLVGGQGLAMPGPAAKWNRVLFPIRIEDRVRMEREIAEQCGCAHRIEPLIAGEVHVVSEGRCDRRPEPAVEVLDNEDDRRFDPESGAVVRLPDGPLRDEPRDRGAQADRILAVLNDRVLPFLVGARNPPIERILGAGGGEWRLRVRFGTTGDHEDRDYRIAFGDLPFRPEPPDGVAGEHVWANDVEDVLDGRADEFSTVCRAPLPAPTQHFWRALGMPWLFPDLVERKLRLHFERARRGEANADYVLPFWGADSVSG